MSCSRTRNISSWVISFFTASFSPCATHFPIVGLCTMFVVEHGAHYFIIDTGTLSSRLWMMALRKSAWSSSDHTRFSGRRLWHDWLQVQGLCVFVYFLDILHLKLCYLMFPRLRDVSGIRQRIGSSGCHSALAYWKCLSRVCNRPVRTGPRIEWLNICFHALNLDISRLQKGSSSLLPWWGK